MEKVGDLESSVRDIGGARANLLHETGQFGDKAHQLIPQRGTVRLCETTDEFLEITCVLVGRNHHQSLEDVRILAKPLILSDKFRDLQKCLQIKLYFGKIKTSKPCLRGVVHQTRAGLEDSLNNLRIFVERIN